MIELELDGIAVSANAGSTILEIALKNGKYIPIFVITRNYLLQLIAACAWWK